MAAGWMGAIRSGVIGALKETAKGIPYLNNIFIAEQLVGSIPEVVLNPLVSAHVVEITKIRDAEIERYSYPREMPISFRTSMSFPQRHVYRMKDVTVNTRMGACCTAERGFLESFGSLRSWILSRPMLIRRSGRRLSIDGPVACINTTSFAHFLMEDLPRLLWALQRYPSLRLITPPSLPRYIEDIYRQLRTMGLLQHDPVATRWPTVDVDDFVFTQADAASGFWHGSDQDLLRSVFLPKTEPRARGRIYVSRRGTRRSFENEKELEDRLRQEGFKVLFLEDLDFRSQIEEFRGAEVVVAPHGAGLANLVWCSPGTRVVEIFSSKVFNDCFARLSSRRSCEHLCCWAKGPGEYGAVDLSEVLELVGGAERHGA